MLGIIILFVVLGIELGFIFYRFRTKMEQNELKHIIRIIEFVLFCILMIFQVVHWSFIWKLLFMVLLIQTVIGIVFFVRKPSKILKNKHVILSCIARCMLLTISIIPAILFPQHKQVITTGQYSVTTESYTLTDAARIEDYSNNGDNRKVTIQFWYPETGTENQTYPLVIFSHGAFGFRRSNYSTFMELASNGYVVCSIDHTYQSFYTKQIDGKTVIVNNDFLNDAVAVENDGYDVEKTYELTHDWLKLRTDDMNFVLDSILGNAKKENADYVYQLIDIHKIGLFGHSLGGATASQLGRERTDIDSVIVIDGTMFGEEVDFINGSAVLNSDSYPVPILNIYNEEHYASASNNASTYANMVASKNAVDSHHVVFKKSGHLNFTDLPLVSPFLAQKLGIGNIDSRYCIETMNNVILDYFNYYLKDGEKLNISNEY